MRLEESYYIVDDNSKYLNLISIGDIQRALISGADINTPINKITIDKKKLQIIKTQLKNNRQNESFTC